MTATTYYDTGDVRLYHGDALEILPTIPAMSVDMVITDPPYVIGAVSAGNMASKSGGWGDMMNSSRWFRDWYAMAFRALKPSGALWTFCNWRSLPVVMKAALDAGRPIASVLVWDKEWIGPGGSVGLRPRYELVALIPGPDFAIPDRSVTDIWPVKWTAIKPNGHPAEKPVPLFRRLLEVSACGEGAVVLDPFAGSGASMCAALDVGASWVGCEQEEQWCRLIVSRAQNQLSLLGGAA